MANVRMHIFNTDRPGRAPPPFGRDRSGSAADCERVEATFVQSDRAPGLVFPRQHRLPRSRVPARLDGRRPRRSSEMTMDHAMAGITGSFSFSSSSISSRIQW